MSEYKSIATIKEEIIELIEYNDIDIDDWIPLDDYLYLTEYLKHEISSEQVDIQWVTISNIMWVCSVIINDGRGFLHFTFKVYDDSEPASTLLN